MKDNSCLSNAVIIRRFGCLYILMKFYMSVSKINDNRISNYKKQGPPYAPEANDGRNKQISPQ